MDQNTLLYHHSCLPCNARSLLLLFCTLGIFSLKVKEKEKMDLDQYPNLSFLLRSIALPEQKGYTSASTYLSQSDVDEFFSKESKDLFQRVASPRDTGELSLKGLAPWLSWKSRIYREKSVVVMETKELGLWVPLTGQMERNEVISRCVWFWISHGAILSDPKAWSCGLVGLLCLHGPGAKTHLKSRCYPQSKVQPKLIILLLIGLRLS